MSVSLVKVYFTAGWSMPGCLPESEPTLFTSLDAAREYLASELERAADDAAQSIGWDDDGQAEQDSASMSASAELIRGDRDGDVTWSAMRGGWSTIEPDGYAYWIDRI